MNIILTKWHIWVTMLFCGAMENCKPQLCILNQMFLVSTRARQNVTITLGQTDSKDLKLHFLVIAWLYFLMYLMTCVIQSTFCCENPWEASEGSLCITTDPGSTNISRSPLDGSSIRMGSPPPISTVRLIFLNFK